jgi:hypothetical protein
MYLKHLNPIINDISINTTTKQDFYQKFLSKKTSSNNPGKKLISNRKTELLKNYYIIHQYTEIFSKWKYCNYKLDQKIIDKFKNDKNS